MAVRRYLTRLVASAAALAVLSPAYALDLSGEKVTILVPFGEGGGSDTLVGWTWTWVPSSQGRKGSIRP